MNKEKKERPSEKTYSTRQKLVISIVCIILAALFLIWTLAGSVFVFGAETGKNGSVRSEAAAVNAQSSQSNNMRGMWVSTIAGDFPSKRPATSAQMKTEIDRIVANCYDLGMNAIFFQVRPASDSFYKSAYYPWSRYITGTQGVAPDSGFDPLAYFVKKAHSKGIELHAWINPYRISSGMTWDQLSADNPAKGAYRNYVVNYKGNYYFDPAQQAVRDLITDGAVEIVKNYDVDGIHFDDYFYPGQDFDDSASYAEYGNGQNKADWRRENVNKLIRQVHEAVHQADSHCVFGVSPRGVWENKEVDPRGSNTRGGSSYSMVYGDSYAWVKNNWVDYIAPQIYWKIGHRSADYRTLAYWWSDLVKGTNVRLYIGIGDYALNSSEISKQLKLNSSLPQIAGEIHFRYKSVANNSALSSLYRNNYASIRTIAATDPAGVTPAHRVWLYDLTGHWAEKNIWSLVDSGLLGGMGDGTFQPDSPVTRAQFVHMLASLSGSDTSGAPNYGFRDVPSNEWYFSDVNWAAAHGIAKGRSLTDFAPSANITREEITVMLENYCREYLPGLEDSSAAADFADEEDISPWAAGHVDAVVRLGLMRGSVNESDGLTYFYPRHHATRAEAAQVLHTLKAKSE